MRSTSINISIIHFTVLSLAFCLGLYFESLGFKVLAFSGLLLAVYAVVMLPLRWALFLVFIYLGVEGFLKVVSNYHPVVHIGSDIMVISLCAKVLWRNFFEARRDFELPPLYILFALHFLWVAITIFNPYALGFIPSIAGAKIYVSMFLLYFFGYYLTSNEKDIQFFMLPFLIVGLIHTVFGLYQGMLGADSVIALHPRYALQLAKYQEYAFRPFGLTNLPGGPAVHMYQTFPFILYFLFHYRSWLAKLSLSIYLPFAATLFFLCQIRSALFKMILASSLFLIGSIHVASKTSVRLTRGLILATTAIGLILAYLTPMMLEYSVESNERNQEAIDRSLTLFDTETLMTGREGAWGRFQDYVGQVPFGAGFARVGAAAGAFKEYHFKDETFGFGYFFTDNFWLTALVEVGIPGMLILTFLIVSILWLGIKSYFSIVSPSLKVLHLALLCSIIGVFVGLYGAEGVLYNPEAAFFWFFSGILMKIPQLDSKNKTAQA